MKNKDYSKWGKFIIVVLAIIASVLKWFNVLGNASISEIWQVAGFAYGILLGTMDFNIIVDGFKEKNHER